MMMMICIEIDLRIHCDFQDIVCWLKAGGRSGKKSGDIFIFEMNGL